MIAKSKAYHEKRHTARAAKKATKRAKNKAQRKNRPTPRNQRISGAQPALIGLFAKSFTDKFEASKVRRAA